MKLINSLLILALALPCIAADPVIPLRVDLKAQRSPFVFEAYQAEQTTVRVYFYNDGKTWNGATNYTATLGFGTNYADSTSMVLSSNRWTSATNYLDFVFTPSQLNNSGSFYAQLMVERDSGGKWVFSDGRVQLKQSPISGGATAQVFLTPVNWDTVESLGTLPWAGADAPVKSVSSRTGDVVIVSSDLADFQSAVSNNTLVAGALQAEADTLATVLGRGNNAEGGAITNAGAVYGATGYGIDFSDGRMIADSGGVTFGSIALQALNGAWTIDTDASTGLQIVNYQSMTNKIESYGFVTVSGISASTATNIANDAWSENYPVPVVDGTATVSRTVSGQYYKQFSLQLTGATTITIDTSTFPTNGGASFSWILDPNGHTLTADSTSIDSNSWAGLTLTTNAYNSVIFYRDPFKTLFKVVGEPE